MVYKICDGDEKGCLGSGCTHTQYNGSHAPGHGYMYNGRRIDMLLVTYNESTSTREQERRELPG
jgi:hypothetical protein